MIIYLNKIVYLFFLLLSVVACKPEKAKEDSPVPPPPGPVVDPDISTNKSIITYNYPDVIVEDRGQGFLKKSRIFTVSIVGEDGKEVPTYVMEDRNSYKQHEPNGAGDNMTDYNHIAQFAFSGSVKVRVRRIDGGSLSDVTLYPKTKGYSYTKEDDYIEIPLSQWAHIYVEVKDLMDKDPLFIFADPPLENIPEKNKWVEVLTPDMSASEVRNAILTTSKKTIYFSEGVYDFNEETVLGNNYLGYQLPLVSNKDYYIPGGAVVVGSFKTVDDGNSDNIRFFGHGVVTAAGKDRLGSDESIPYNLFLSYGDNNLIEGIQFLSPSHFAVLSRGSLITKHAKMFGWWHQTDGWGAEDDSTIENCFIKANDDNIKIYSTRQKVKNVIIYKQINGAGIQFGWGATGNAKDCIIEDLYIVHDDPVFPNPNQPDNGAVANLRNNAGSTINNITFKNIYIECDVQRIIGFQNNGGVMSNFLFENIKQDGVNRSTNNYLIGTKSNGTYGSFSNFTFKNCTIKGVSITSDSQDGWNMKQVTTENMDKKSKWTNTNLTTIKYE